MRPDFGSATIWALVLICKKDRRMELPRITRLHRVVASVSAALSYNLAGCMDVVHNAKCSTMSRSLAAHMWREPGKDRSLHLNPQRCHLFSTLRS